MKDRLRIRPACVLAVAVVLLVASGCTQMAGPLGGGDLPSTDAETKQHMAGEPIGDVHWLDRAVALRAVESSTEFAEAASRFLNASAPVLARGSDSTVIVSYDVKPDRSEVRQDTTLTLYPAMVFLVDVRKGAVLDVVVVRSNLDSREMIITSLGGDVLHSEPMPPERIERLEATRSSSYNRRTADWRASVKRPCDDSITEPTTVCWCEEEIPGHFDPACLDTCMGICGLLPPPWNTLCAVGCLTCWVNGYCVWDCETIYPCDW